MIELVDVSYYFGKRLALSNVSFKIKRGEKVVLLGPNGSGKSTLLKVLAGLIFPQKGEYLFEGENIDKKKLENKEYERYFRRKVQILFQEPDIMLFNPTVFDEIAYSIRTFGLDNVKIKVGGIANFWGIDNLLSRPVYLLSGGEKAKVALSSILVIEPSYVLLDEPTAYLDMKSTRKLRDYIINGQFTSIIAMHDLHLARHFGNRFIVISEEHKIIFDGSFDELMESGLIRNYSFFDLNDMECRKEGEHERV